MFSKSLLRNLATASCACSLLLSGCGGSSSSGAPVSSSSETSSLSRAMTPAVAATTEQAVVTAVNSLGRTLLGEGVGNAIVAPFSASVSLARLRVGSAGASRTDLSASLLLPTPVGEIDSAYNKLELSISDRITSLTLDGQTSRSSSSGWIQARYGYLLTYLDTLALNYGVKPARTDFAADQYGSTALINSWAAQASGGLISSFATYQNCRLALGDAVRLNALWLEPFDATLNQTDLFQRLDGSYTETLFLRKSGLIRQSTGSGYQALELPLTGNDLRLLIILPDEGSFAAVKSALTANRLNEIAAAMTTTPMDLKLPIFSIESEQPLLLNASATTANIADFSAVDSTKDLYVSASLQRSRLSISAGGIKAGAATLIALDDAHPETWTNPYDNGFGYDSSFIFISGGTNYYSFPDTIPVSVGRPFIFALRDSVTGVILFLGQVVDPTK